MLTPEDRARIIAGWQSAARWVRDMQRRAARVEQDYAAPRRAAALAAEVEREARIFGGAA